MSSGDSPSPAELTFPGDGEMALRMRAYPWATSPLGDPRDWPASLRTACRICLTSRFPMIVWWGEELRFLYNDAYLPLLGSKHPALGRPGDQVWSEIWATIGPMLDSVLHTGQATWSEDLLLPMNRHGYWEETYWTYSYSPLHDDDGTVRGVFTAVRDTTEAGGRPAPTRRAAGSGRPGGAGSQRRRGVRSGRSGPGPGAGGGALRRHLPARAGWRGHRPDQEHLAGHRSVPAAGRTWWLAGESGCCAAATRSR